MPWITLYECDVCSYRGEFVSYQEHCQRVLCTGRAIPIDVELAWCNTCRALAEVETLISLDEIDAELEIAGSGKKKTKKWWGEGPWRRLANSLKNVGSERRREEYISVVSEIREWIIRRQSPARCLRCGGADVVVGHADESIVHPGCGGRISEAATDHCVIEWRDGVKRLIDTEGKWV